MIKLNINKMELPIFEVIKATPFCIPLTKKCNMFFEIPSTEKYFDFENKYLKILLKYFLIFSKVNFLELKDFEDEKLKDKMIKDLYIIMQNKNFKKDFLSIIKKYLTADFNLRKIFKIANPFQTSYIFLFIHSIVENVKKNYNLVAKKCGVQMKEISSFSLKAYSTKIEPRF